MDLTISNETGRKKLKNSDPNDQRSNHATINAMRTKTNQQAVKTIRTGIPKNSTASVCLSIEKYSGDKAARDRICKVLTFSLFKDFDESATTLQ